MEWGEICERADKLAHWIRLLDEAYEDVLSRLEETASVSGLRTAEAENPRDRPKTRPCEHRAVWYRGKLCLACDNTGWRPCAKGEDGLDPYAAQVSGGVTFVRDESEGVARARELRRIDSELENLKRDVRIRSGVEAREDRSMRSYRLVQRKGRTVTRILRGLEYLRSYKPWLYEELPSRSSLIALAVVMYFVAPGRIERAPGMDTST